jgi:hypothetical protein
MLEETPFRYEPAASPVPMAVALCAFVSPRMIRILVLLRFVVVESSLGPNGQRPRAEAFDRGVADPDQVAKARAEP